MNLSEIRDNIRAECDIKGLREYQTLIDWMVNQELIRMTGKAKYADLWTQVITTAATPAVYTFPLPSDYLLFESLIYQQQPLSANTLGQWPLAQGFQNGWIVAGGVQGWNTTWGYPRYYARAAGNMTVYPYQGVQIGDNFILSYYKKVIISLDTDEIPVPSLELPIQLQVIGRLQKMTDTAKASVSLRLAESARVDTRAREAGAS